MPIFVGDFNEKYVFSDYIKNIKTAGSAQPSLFVLIQADHSTLTVSTLSKAAGKFLFGQKVLSISPEPISDIKSVLSDAIVMKMKIWLGR